MSKTDNLTHSSLIEEFEALMVNAEDWDAVRAGFNELRAKYGGKTCASCDAPLDEVLEILASWLERVPEGLAPKDVVNGKEPIVHSTKISITTRPSGLLIVSVSSGTLSLDDFLADNKPAD